MSLAVRPSGDRSGDAAHSVLRHLAQLDQTESAVVLASGMAAMACTMVSLLRPTGNVVGSGMDEAPKTKFAREHVRPTIYGQMIDGKPGSGPNRSVYKDF